jgi:hypothetical protein
VWDVTPDVAELPLNQHPSGSLETPYSIDRWNFSAVANTQVQFDLVDVSQPGIQFKWTQAPTGNRSPAPRTTAAALPRRTSCARAFTRSVFGIRDAQTLPRTKTTRKQ